MSHQRVLPNLWLRTVAVLLLGLPKVCLAAAPNPNPASDGPKPNVIFILADDLGFSDTTLFGTTQLYETPNLQRLAARGMTFSHAYSSSPLCSPTRASVLTGLSPARHGITAPVCHMPQVIVNAQATPVAPPNQKSTTPKSATRLATSHYTLAEMFRDHGYSTGHFGKWHLGPEPYSPLQHGFQVDLPHHPGPGPAGSYVAPWKFKDFDHDPNIPDEHLEDRMAKEAVAFMEQNRDRPFFLNYWMFSVHAPFDAKTELVEKYRDKVGLVQGKQRSPTYAAMIESMDDAVGTLLDTIDRLGIADNTIVIFASDNGGNMYNRVDGVTATDNAPLRGGKANMYEGGIRGPAIVVHTDVVRPASKSREVIQSSDFYPTLLELLSIDPQSGQAFDGISIVPALRGEVLDREAIFTYFPHAPPIPNWMPPAVAVHHNQWKLIRIFHGGDSGRHRFKLYDLSADVGEQVDLADSHPEVVKRLDRMIARHLEETAAVLPLANPNFNPAVYDPSREGLGKLKETAPKKARRKSRPAGKPVAGWQPGGTCDLKLDAEALVMTSDGGDPYMSFTFKRPIDAERLTLRIRMRSEGTGFGQVFWASGQVPFGADRSERFDANHDGNWNRYEVELSPQKPVSRVRIDPARSPGVIAITEIQLVTDDDRVLHQWRLQ